MRTLRRVLLKSFLLTLLTLTTWPAFAQHKSILAIRSAQKNLARTTSRRLPGSPLPSFGTQLERRLIEITFRPPLVIPASVVTNTQILFVKKAKAPLPNVRVQVPFRSAEVFPGKERIDAVIFDMDGTLLDSLPSWKNSASNFLRSQGIEPPEGFDDEMSKLALMEGAQQIKERFGFEQSAQEILDATLAPIWEHYRTDIQAKPGALALLERLHAQGIKISVATASHKELAQEAFTRLGMSPYIDFIITCDEVGVGKQDPAVYDVALEQMGTRKERTLVVEDALYALQTAKKAGYLTAGVAEPFHSQEHNYNVSLTGDYFILSFLDGYVWLR